MRDVGTVIDNVENVRLGGWVDGQPAVIVDIQRQPGREHHRDRQPRQSAVAQAARDRSRPR